MQRSTVDVNGFRTCGFASIISKCDVKGKIYERKETVVADKSAEDVGNVSKDDLIL